MFAPIADFPIGALDADPGLFGDASGGTFDVSGASAGGVAIVGAGADTFTLSGAAVGQGGIVEESSLLGFGPIAAGALGEMLSLASPIVTITGGAAGSISFTGSASGVLPIIGRAPDIVLTAWNITAGNASATINAWPDPPTTPPWLITIGAPGFSIVEFPNYVASASAVPFFDIIGSAVGGTPLTGAANGAFTVSGSAAMQALISAIAVDTMTFDGIADGFARVGGIGSGVFDILGTADGRYGVFPLSGIGADLFDIAGIATMTTIVAIDATDAFELIGESTAVVDISGTADGAFNIITNAQIAQPSSRRRAFPRDSLNDGEIISEQQESRIIQEA